MRSEWKGLFVGSSYDYYLPGRGTIAGFHASVIVGMSAFWYQWYQANDANTLQNSRNGSLGICPVIGWEAPLCRTSSTCTSKVSLLAKFMFPRYYLAGNKQGTLDTNGNFLIGLVYALGTH